MTTLNRRKTLGLTAGATLIMATPGLARNGADPGTQGPSARELTHDPDQPVLGNPDGDVTLVAFFDYQCPYCRKAHPDIMDFVAGDGKLRLVMKDWPIFGPVSDRATMIALGSVALGRYAQANAAMMGLSGRKLQDADIDKAVAGAGISPDAALRSFQADYDKWTAMVGRNMGMAEMLGLMGTPAYVVGQDVFAGVTRISALKKAVDAVRAA